jgi:hypothetical protein
MMNFFSKKGEVVMKKPVFFSLIGVAVLLMWIPGMFAEANAYDLRVYVNSYDDNVYPGDMWDATVQVYNPC